MSNLNVLLIDDDEMTFNLIQAAIGDKHTIYYRNSGETALQDIAKLHIDVVLLDIKLGKGIDGYSCCRLIRKLQLDNDLHIIFLSGYEKKQEILQAYSSGGDDYILKPFNQYELLKKIAVAQRKASHHLVIKNELNGAKDMAMTAMRASSVMGNVIRFLTDCNRFNSVIEVAEKISLVLDSWGLKSTVRIKTDFEAMSYSLQGPVSSLEEKFIDLAQEQGRIYDIDNRTCISSARISVLIKNMPVAEKADCGDFKDNISILVDGAHGRLCTINDALELKHQHETLYNVIDKLSSAVNRYETELEGNEGKFISVLEDLETHMEKSYAYLDLTEDQENDLRNMLNDVRNSYLEAKQSQKTLHSVFQRYKHVLSEQDNAI